MSKLTLFLGSKRVSSWSLRPWIALKQANIPFREEVILLDRPDTRANILKHSPSGRIPALSHGDLTVWDSLAICEYLAETFPEAHLWPEAKAERAVARSVCAEMHAGFQALRAQLSFCVDEAAPAKLDAAGQADVDRVVQIWSDCRARAKGGPFLFGTFTNADAMYAPVVVRFRMYGVKVSARAAEYADAMWQLPAMAEWIAAGRAEPA